MALEPKICVAVIVLAAVSAFGFGRFLLECLLGNWGTALVAFGSSFAAMLCLCYLAIKGERKHRVERYITTAKREAEKFKKRKG